MTSTNGNLARNLTVLTLSEARLRIGMHGAIAQLSGISETSLHKIKRGTTKEVRYSTVLAIAAALTRILGINIATDDLYRSPNSNRMRQAAKMAQDPEVVERVRAMAIYGREVTSGP